MSCNNCHNSNFMSWLMGGALAVLGLVGLYLAAHTAGGAFYLHGLGLFGLCVAGIFRLIGRYYDAAGRAHHPHPH